MAAAGVRTELLSAFVTQRQAREKDMQDMQLQDQLLAIEPRLWTNDTAFHEANLTDADGCQQRPVGRGWEPVW